jgi:hypothetical protein
MTPRPTISAATVAADTKKLWQNRSDLFCHKSIAQHPMIGREIQTNFNKPNTRPQGQQKETPK